jgi:DNA-binding IclR family transcriptional regulator
MAREGSQVVECDESVDCAEGVEAEIGGCDKDNSTIGVLQRAGRLLTCFDNTHPSVTLSEAVRHTGLPKTTVHRLLHDMTSLGWLDQRGGTFFVGRRLFELGTLSPIARGLREVALPYMQDLFAATGQTVQLAVLASEKVLYVERVRGHRDINPIARPGSQMPLHCTALGKVMLAFSSEALLESVVAGPLPPRTRATIATPQRLRREISNIQDLGIAFDMEEAAPGLICVAAPILGSDGRAMAAVSLSAPAGVRRLDQFAPAVRTTTAAIGRELRRGRPTRSR